MMMSSWLLSWTRCPTTISDSHSSCSPFCYLCCWKIGAGCGFRRGRSMGEDDRLFGRRRSVHEILGGGFVADVMLWRTRNVTIGILLGTLAVWMVFEVSGYTLLSLVSTVLLLLISILFVWAKAAAALNRPAPPIPEMHISEEVVHKALLLVHTKMNVILSGFHGIAIGKDSKLFYRVFAYLWLFAIIGSWTDFLTLSYTSLVILLTIPVLYERYEDNIEKCVRSVLVEMLQYEKVYAEWFNNLKDWILEKQKELS